MKNQTLLIITGGMLIISGLHMILTIFIIIFMSGRLLPFELLYIGKRLLISTCIFQICSMTLVAITYVIFKSKYMFCGAIITLFAFVLLALKGYINLIIMMLLVLGLMLLCIGISSITNKLGAKYFDLIAIIFLVLFPVAEIMYGIAIIYLRKRIQILQIISERFIK